MDQSMGGSGFMPEDTGNPNGKKSDSRETRSVISINNNQINNLTTSKGIVIHQQKISYVRLVGRVTAVNEQSTKCSYFIDDGTGPTIEATMWKGVSGQDTPMDQDGSDSIIMEGHLVNIYGQARRNNEQATIIVYHIKQVEDPNEYTVHALEALYQAKSLKQRKVAILNGETGARVFGAGAGNFGGQSSEKGGFGGGGMTDVQMAVMQAVGEMADERGISAEGIQATLPNYTIEKIREALSFLSGEGHVYSTFDEEHFKCIE